MIDKLSFSYIEIHCIHTLSRRHRQTHTQKEKIFLKMDLNDLNSTLARLIKGDFDKRLSRKLKQTLKEGFQGYETKLVFNEKLIQLILR